MSRYFASSGQSIGAWASASVFSMNIQGWFLFGLSGLISLQSKGLKSLLQHHDLNVSIPWCSVFFMVQLLHLYMTTEKTITLTIQTFFNKMISLPFHTLSWSVIAFLSRSKRFVISWLQWQSTVILEPKKNLSLFPFFSLSICHEMMGLDAVILVYWMLSFKPAFSLLFHFHQEAL